MSVPPLPSACLVAALAWLAAEISVIRETVRRFRTGESRRLAVFACICVAADLATIAAGVAAICARNLDVVTPGWWRFVNWPTTLAMLAMSIFPVGLLCLLEGVCLACGALLVHGNAETLGRGSLLLATCLVLLASPFVRFRLFRHHRGLAVFACLTACLPLFPVFVPMVLGGTF